MTTETHAPLSDAELQTLQEHAEALPFGRHHDNILALIYELRVARAALAAIVVMTDGWPDQATLRPQVLAKARAALPPKPSETTDD
jgi:hypothetical protein